MSAVDRSRTVQRSIERGLIAGLLWMGAACEEDQDRRDEVCVASCTEAGCGAGIPCTTNDQCPLATSCAPEGICRPKLSEFPSSTDLVRGFQTDEIQLTRGEASAFDVEAPRSATYVICAIFIGTPIFRDRALANVGASVARERVFSLDPDRSESSELSLRLDDLEPTTPSAECPFDSALKAPRDGFRVVESLHLGCWSMNLQGITGASRLLPIDPSELLESAVAPLPSCDQSQAPTDGSICQLPSPVGVCQANRCITGPAEPPPDTELPPPPVSACNVEDAGDACSLDSPGVGRCYAGNCLDQGDATLLTPLVAATCEVGDWVNCFPSPLGLVGTCFGGRCRQRCHDGSECGMSGDCQRLSSSYLGACVEPPEMTP